MVERLNQTLPASEALVTEYLRAVEIPDLFPNLFSRNQWAWALRNRERNGLYRAVRRLGRRLIVHVPTLLEVIDDHTERVDP